MGFLDFAKDTGKTVNSLQSDQFEKEIKDNGLEVEDLKTMFKDSVIRVSGKTKNQEDREKVLLTLGNIKGVERVDDALNVEEASPEASFYTVKSGDNLSKIAKDHYGSANKYMTIFEANKPMLGDPNKIYPGQVLRIPKE